MDIFIALALILSIGLPYHTKAFSDLSSSFVRLCEIVENEDKTAGLADCLDNFLTSEAGMMNKFADMFMEHVDVFREMIPPDLPQYDWLMDVIGTIEENIDNHEMLKKLFGVMIKSNMMCKFPDLVSGLLSADTFSDENVDVMLMMKFLKCLKEKDIDVMALVQRSKNK